MTITCPRCARPLYPRTARRTDDGWICANARSCGKARAALPRIEDLRWMAAHGESAQGAAARLGITKAEALRRWCVRHDIEDVWRTLRARDPLDLDPGRQIQRLGWEAVA